MNLWEFLDLRNVLFTEVNPRPKKSKTPIDMETIDTKDLTFRIIFASGYSPFLDTETNTPCCRIMSSVLPSLVCSVVWSLLGQNKNITSLSLLISNR